MQATTKRPSIFVMILGSVFVLLFAPAVVMLSAGNWHWIEGWLFSLWLDAMVLSNYFYLYFKNPELLAERTKAPGSDNQKQWDRVMQKGAYLLAMAWLVLIPLDAMRFHWSPAFPLWLKVFGGVMLLPSLFLIYRATVDNTYLSAMVRLQSDRGQQVVSTGVYSFVRHPLYLGVLLMLFGAPLLTGSLWSLIISVIAFVTLIARIFGEEQMLITELEGYAEYKQKVKYRLLPLIW